MNVLLFAGSLRKDSFNKKLMRVAAAIADGIPDTKTTIADLKELSIPIYDGDVEDKDGIPAGVKRLGEMIQAAQALIIVSPEYNGSISSPLKNAVDWVSRLQPLPLAKKPILLMGTSPGAFGAVRALTSTKVPLENLGSYIYPQPFALPKAEEALSAAGALTDPAAQKKLSELIAAYLQFAKKLSQ